MLTVIADGDVLVAAPMSPTDITAAEATSFEVSASQLPAGARVVLDMTTVGFLDSAGVGGLVRLARRLDDGGGELRLAGPQAAVRTVLELVRLHRLVEVHATRSAAIDSFRSDREPW